VRVSTTFSQWTSVETEEACAREGFQADMWFAIKSIMKQQKVKSLVFNFVVSVIIFGFAVRSFER
jgi:hypothetical protein